MDLRQEMPTVVIMFGIIGLYDGVSCKFIDWNKKVACILMDMRV